MKGTKTSRKMVGVVRGKGKGRGRKAGEKESRLGRKKDIVLEVGRKRRGRKKRMKGEDIARRSGGEG